MPATENIAIAPSTARIPARPADVVRELGPFEGHPPIHGVSFDGTRLWAATGPALLAIEPEHGTVTRTLDLAGDAGTAFDGTHLWQIAEKQIHRIEPATGRIVASIPAPADGCDSGLAWAEGSLWVGEYRARRIHEVDPATGAVRRSIASDRFVTGVSWSDGELWHGTWEGDESEVRRIDATTGEVLDRLRMPDGTGVSGLEADADGRLWCGGGPSGKLRAIRKPAARAR